MTVHEVHQRHDRTFATNRFVYPVVSRRSAGLSIGINLNPDKVCNFDCIYCQVDRTTKGDTEFVELPRLVEELTQALELAASGRVYDEPRLASTPPALRRLSDLAFSGDGEPTTHRNFDEVVAACAEVKRRLAPPGVKMVLITNASMFHRPHVRRGLDTLMANDGEIWGKLDAGSDEYFQRIDRTSIPFRQVLENLEWAARRWPIVLQSLFMRVLGAGPELAEIDAYCARVKKILAAGGAIGWIQIYTVARRPAESFVAPLSDAEVDAIAARVRSETGIETRAYYGAATENADDNA